MATAVSKPASHPPKMKRPPPPFAQNGVNGVKPSQPSSSPSTASKRLPGASQSASANSAGNSAANNGNNRTVNRPKKEMQKQGEPPSRLQRPTTRTATAEVDRRMAKKFPEPYVKTTSYILKKYSKCPPSLILHLHPTHFRFDQQDGSFPYNSEMKVIIEHIRAGTVPHDMLEELLRAGVRFYEGCLIVRVVDHKSVSAQANKSSSASGDEKSAPFSMHNYNQHITPSAYVPYPKQNQTLSGKTETKSPVTAPGSQSDAKTQGDEADAPHEDDKETETEEGASQKQPSPKPRVFTTVLHPTPRSLQAELTLLSTTPDPRAAVNRKQPGSHGASRAPSSSTAPHQSALSTNAGDRGPAPKRQKMLVEPQDLLECESKLIRALAPPLYLEPVDSLAAAQDLLKFLESPLHRDPPPSPKTRKRTVAELAADEALAAEEERFMLIMDERLEPTTSATAGGAKSAVDDAGGAAPFEPRFSRFKTLENIRMQHEEKAKREHERKLQQDHAKRQQQQEQERERRRLLEQRQAEENAKEEARRQQLAAQQAQAQLAQQQNRHAMAQANGMAQVSQGPQSSPVVRNQTPHSTSSPLVGSTMATQAGVPMSMTASAQGAGSPQRPPSALQHAHPGVMGHPMAPSRSQQGQSRHGTPQMTQGTPAMSHATPVMRNVTPTQRMGHASPNNTTMAQTPVMNHAMMGTPQMSNGMGLTPQQQMLIQQRQQQMLAQQGHVGHGQFTPQQIAQIHAQQNIQPHQQHMMQAHQAQQNHHQQQQQHNSMQKLQSQQAYQAQLMRAQFVQMQVAQQQQHNQQQHHQGSPHQMTPQQQQQQQMLVAAAQANGGHLPQNLQAFNMSQRYQQLYQQQLLRLRQEMARRYMAEYGPPTQYPPQIAQLYGPGLEKRARIYVQEVMRQERESSQQQRASQAAVQAQVMQQQQQNMMHNGMGK
ncbi:hypothetical protein VTN00DRAFT_9515 [Thermoascus crustaceus]|uniref:uncharacterized protein n=1 Tax=Thermoascus crustaceus TaxID=5088 RepID=UPI0037420565